MPLQSHSSKNGAKIDTEMMVEDILHNLLEPLRSLWQKLHQRLYAESKTGRRKNHCNNHHPPFVRTEIGAVQSITLFKCFISAALRTGIEHRRNEHDRVGEHGAVRCGEFRGKHTQSKHQHTAKNASDQEHQKHHEHAADSRNIVIIIGKEVKRPLFAFLEKHSIAHLNGICTTIWYRVE